MRIKTFTAKSMHEAIEEVRRELGSDAIIVNSEQASDTGGVRVTAALEKLDSEYSVSGRGTVPATKVRDSQPESKRRVAMGTRPFDIAELKAVLSYHSVPFDLAERILDVANSTNSDSLVAALSNALDSLFPFASLQVRANRPNLVLGPPGSGKTVAIAKMATESVLNGRKVRIFSTDSMRSGGLEQLRRFAHKLELEVEVAQSAEDLGAMITPIRSGLAKCDHVVIDTRGINPFDLDEMNEARRLIDACDADACLTLPAGLDSQDVSEIAIGFASIGISSLIASRLDTARRYGSILAALNASKMKLVAVSRTPFIAQVLETASPSLLSRLMASLPEPNTLDLHSKERDFFSSERAKP